MEYVSKYSYSFGDCRERTEVRMPKKFSTRYLASKDSCRLCRLHVLVEWCFDCPNTKLQSHVCSTKFLLNDTETPITCQLIGPPSSNCSTTHRLTL